MRPDSTGTSDAREREVDVAVVGAGPAGCTLAYLLARSAAARPAGTPTAPDAPPLSTAFDPH